MTLRLALDRLGEHFGVDLRDAGLADVVKGLLDELLV